MSQRLCPSEKKTFRVAMNATVTAEILRYIAYVKKKAYSDWFDVQIREHFNITVICLHALTLFPLFTYRYLNRNAVTN